MAYWDGCALGGHHVGMMAMDDERRRQEERRIYEEDRRFHEERRLQEEEVQVYGTGGRRATSGSGQEPFKFTSSGRATPLSDIFPDEWSVRPPVHSLCVARLVRVVITVSTLLVLIQLVTTILSYSNPLLPWAGEYFSNSYLNVLNTYMWMWPIVALAVLYCGYVGTRNVKHECWLKPLPCNRHFVACSTCCNCLGFVAYAILVAAFIRLLKDTQTNYKLLCPDGPTSAIIIEQPMTTCKTFDDIISNLQEAQSYIFTVFVIGAVLSLMACVAGCCLISSRDFNPVSVYHEEEKKYKLDGWVSGHVYDGQYDLLVCNLWSVCLIGCLISIVVLVYQTYV